MWPMSIFSQALNHLPTSAYGLVGIGFIILGFIALAVIRLHKEQAVSQRTFFAVGILFLGLLSEVHFAQETIAPSTVVNTDQHFSSANSVTNTSEKLTPENSSSVNKSPDPMTSNSGTEPAIILKPCSWSSSAGEGANSTRSYSINYMVKNQGQLPITRFIIQYAITDTTGAPMISPATFEPRINTMIPLNGTYPISDVETFSFSEPSSALASITCKIIAVYGPGGYAWTLSHD